MGLHPYKNLTQWFASALFGVVFCCLQLVLQIQMHEAPGIAGLFFVLGLIFITISIFIGTDLFSKRQICFEGKVINKEGRVVNVLTTEEKLKQVKITVPEVYGQLEVNQKVEFKLTQIMKMPVSIRIMENAPEDRDEAVHS